MKTDIFNGSLSGFKELRIILRKAYPTEGKSEKNSITLFSVSYPPSPLTHPPAVGHKLSTGSFSLSYPLLLLHPTKLLVVAHWSHLECICHQLLPTTSLLPYPPPECCTTLQEPTVPFANTICRTSGAKITSS